MQRMFEVIQRVVKQKGEIIMFEWRNNEVYLRKLNAPECRDIKKRLNAEVEAYLKSDTKSRFYPSRSLRAYARELGYHLTRNVSKYVPDYTFYVD